MIGLENTKKKSLSNNHSNNASIQDVNLTPSQQVALDKCVKWFRDGCKKQVFRLYGAAGTGKSFIVGRIISKLGICVDDVAFATPTGKAATVLMQRFNYPKISTLCHLIYKPYTLDKLVLTDKNEIEKIESTTKFSLKDDIECDLVVLDEVSMVDKEQMQDLLSFGVPIIAIGDPYQLPPINDKPLDPNGADALLTEVVRQEANNPIIQIATMIKNGKMPVPGTYGENAIVIEKSKITPEMQMQMMLAADQVICGLNKTRRTINRMMRKRLGFSDRLPQVNDKIICKSNEPAIMLTNNINLCNGMIGKCHNDCKIVGDMLTKIKFSADIFPDIKYSLLSDAGVYFFDDFVYDPHWIAYKMRNETYAPHKKVIDEMRKYDMKLYRQLTSENARNKSVSLGKALITRFDFAYAISCHASQGSEFDNVVVIDESYAFRSNAYRWLYTAVTRAKKRLIIIV